MVRLFPIRRSSIPYGGGFGSGFVQDGQSSWGGSFTEGPVGLDPISDQGINDLRTIWESFQRASQDLGFDVQGMQFANPQTLTSPVNITHAVPTLRFIESDQTDPNGFQMGMSANDFIIQRKNAAGNWSEIGSGSGIIFQVDDATHQVIISASNESSDLGSVFIYGGSDGAATDGGAVEVAGSDDAGAGRFKVSTPNAARSSARDRILVDGNADTADINLDYSIIDFRANYPTQTTVGAAGGASALPATPTGYVRIKRTGTDFVIPYYDQS